MQFEDPKSILEAAAAKPSRGLDAHALVERGARLRRARLAAAATGMAVVVVAASASFGMLTDGRDDAAPGPAAPSPGRCAESSRVSMYLRDGVDAGEGRELARLLDRQLRDLDASWGAEYVSKRQAYRELVRSYEDGPEHYEELPWTALPARLDLDNVDDATIERLHRMLEAQIETMQRRTATTTRDGTCTEVVTGEAPVEPAPPTDDPVSAGEDDGTATVDVLRAECRSKSINGSISFRDASKWCRFVLYVDNSTGRPLSLDLDDQLLRAANGDGTPPFHDAAATDFSTRLFTSPIPPHSKRMGEIAFILPPMDVPAALELYPDLGFAPASVPLEYDCELDLRNEPRRRCFFSPDSDPVAFTQTYRRVEVTLYHCGVDPLVVEGLEWVVQDPPFDATNAPEGFTGRGRFERKSAITAVYVDDGGEQILFEVVPDWEQPICG